MPPPLSSGILLFARRNGQIEVLLVKPGGPFWKRKDEGAWMIPKGMVEQGETPVAGALREFEEEIGLPLTQTPVPLCRVQQSGGKLVEVFAVEGELDLDAFKSNSFEMEWPPRSGKRQSFPEVEEVRWMTLRKARTLMLPSQLPILDALEGHLGV